MISYVMHLLYLAYTGAIITSFGSFFHLFDNSTAKLLISLDLANLQLIKSSEQPRSDVSRLFPLKL
ncbi:hypothetical protein PsorP6_002549 [Peronosclerospora sorghi]|uniref:Uncharacterized protein n=1 Tax=Peronosclerospora sorghi TaxID=230839 RepID=A0ACC0WXU0_9STRA|nr:hypothetical protein PsorP6_002549 [Peronosclerospora sorghi]